MEKEKNKALYEPIPQWFQKENGTVIGIKDLYLIRTCGSDNFIRVSDDGYEVLDYTMRERKLIASSMEEAIRYLKESYGAILVYSYRVVFRMSDDTLEVWFKTNAPENVIQEATKLFPYQKELFSLISKEQASSVFVKLVKDVYGYLIQESNQEEIEITASFTISLCCEKESRYEDS